MKSFYVIGNKSSKSLSPLIFNYWFKKYKIKARYGHIQLSTKNFDKKINQILKEKNTYGLNITIPFKEKIMAHLNSIDKNAQMIGAVNCISKTDEGFDFFLFSQTIEHLYNPHLAIRNIRNAMKPSGLVFTSVPTINIPHMTPVHFGGYTPMGLASMFILKII